MLIISNMRRGPKLQVEAKQDKEDVPMTDAEEPAAAGAESKANGTAAEPEPSSQPMETEPVAGKPEVIFKTP